MKKLLIMTCLAFGSMSGQAQEVFNRLYESASAVIADPEASESKTKLNHFYITALNYIKGTAAERTEAVTTTFLDTQAYYLSEFVGSFFKNLSLSHQVSAECQHRVVMAYINASLENPLFHDKDTEKVNAFVYEKGCLTPFCLDTNWEEAYHIASEKANKLLSDKK